MLIVLSIFGYFVLSFLWVFYSIKYAPDDVALSFYDGFSRDRIDHGWLLLNIFFWPFMGIMFICLFVCLWRVLSSVFWTSDMGSRVWDF